MQIQSSYTQLHTKATSQNGSLRTALFAFSQNLRLNTLRPIERGFSTIYSYYYYPRYAAAHSYSTQTNYSRKQR